MLSFETVNYIDRACTGGEAFSMLLPRGWEFSGGIRWSPDEVMMPAALAFELSGTDVTLQALPGKAFFWTDLMQVRARYPIGAGYLGAVVCPPLDVADLIRSVILPSARPEATGLKIIDERSLGRATAPYAGLDFKDCGSSSMEAYRMHVEYEMGDRRAEEEIFCTIADYRFDVPVGNHGFGYIFWMVDDIFSFSAEKGKLDGPRDILQAVMSSIRLSPQWLEKYQRIKRYLKDRQVFRQSSLRQISRDVDAFSGPDAGAVMPLLARRQSIYRLIADNLGDGAALGEYYDPVQQICVRLPDGYDHAWADGSGEYLLSNDGNLVPDGSFTEIWKRMERIRLESQKPEPPAAWA